ncbi:hypothetical protein FEM33_06605 [Dyadobacter flavalbus]|uniref:Uncharacterized protein n=1 Tax=Dyadobacter flavalbus TaxID=2579942 RepID=A0A5M8QXZ4_9BACT|nr:hypothetical protein [Dyadobacter flavalbus]KAA6440271.1 hypothetical protein FEM33_06605 [Dyadobacter flavalbus]
MTGIGRIQNLTSESLCQIIREKEFDESVKEILKEFDRIFELDSAIDWVLSRNPTPEEIEKIDELGHYLWVTEDFTRFGIPSVRILYNYDEIERIVTLIGIEKSSSD